jgi:hypothetical protein
METHDRLHILAEHSVDASHGPPPSMSEQLDRQHLQHAGDLLSFASLGAGPSVDADGFGRIFADQAHEQTTEAEMAGHAGAGDMHDDAGEYQVEGLSTGMYEQGGEGDIFGTGEGNVDDEMQGMGLDGIGGGMHGAALAAANMRKKKRKPPKALNQLELEQKKAAHVSFDLLSVCPLLCPNSLAPNRKKLKEEGEPISPTE